MCLLVLTNKETYWQDTDLIYFAACQWILPAMVNTQRAQLETKNALLMLCSIIEALGDKLLWDRTNPIHVIFSVEYNILECTLGAAALLTSPAALGSLDLRSGSLHL